MPFRFSLSPLLKLREGLERQEYFRLLEIQQEIVRVTEEIAENERLQRTVEANRLSELANGEFASELQDAYGKLRSLALRGEALLSHLRQAEARKEQQLGIYRVARQAREILERLRLRQHAEYVREQSRREQARADELFLARLNRKD